LPATSGDEPTVPAAAGEGDKHEGRRAREKEQEEEDNTLTLDQYLAQKAEKEASALPKLETRKANEGAGDSLWKDVIPVQKSDEEAYFATKVMNASSAVLMRGEGR
jgi:plasminogen activator inhibitor 1 RNA-binding protein